MPATPSEGADAADPRARQALQSAFDNLYRANTARFDVDVPFAENVGLRDRGSYQLRPLAYELSRELTYPDATMRISYRGIGDEFWLRMDSMTSDGGDATSWPCWVNYADLAELGDVVAELPVRVAGQAPNAITAASYGVGERIVSGELIEGTTDLVLALSSLSGKFVGVAGIDPQADDTVPATFSVDGGILSGFSVELADLPAAVEAAVGEVGPEIKAIGDLPGEITTRFSEVGRPVSVQAPPRDERLKFSSEADYEAAMRSGSCGW